MITLNGNESTANGQLRFGRYETRSTGRFLATAKDAGNSVGFCQESGVDYAEADADGSPLDTTNGIGRPQDKKERHGVAE